MQTNGPPLQTGSGPLRGEQTDAAVTPRFRTATNNHRMNERRLTA